MTRLTLVARHIEVSKLVEEKALHDGRDEERGCWFIDDDAVCALTPTLHSSLCLLIAQQHMHWQHIAKRA